jgi:hypothetical protein
MTNSELLAVEFIYDYLIKNSSTRQRIVNQKLGKKLRDAFNMKTHVHESFVRKCINHIRTKMNIINQTGDLGWVCGDSDGYWISFNADEIQAHLYSFQGKILKMMTVHQKGQDVLMGKMRTKQLEMFQAD